MLPQQRGRGDEILNAITLKQVPAEGLSNTFEYCSYILSKCMQNYLFIMMMQRTWRITAGSSSEGRRMSARNCLCRRRPSVRPSVFKANDCLCLTPSQSSPRNNGRIDSVERRRRRRRNGFLLRNYRSPKNRLSSSVSKDDGRRRAPTQRLR